MFINISKRRQVFVALSICAIFVFLAVRLYVIQILDYDLYKKKADNQHRVMIKLKPKRGSIYDSKNRVLALDTTLNSVYAVPKEIKDKEDAATRLSDILKIDRSFVLRRLSRTNSFAWIKRKISDEDAAVIKNENIDGVYFQIETKRFYPNNRLLCHLLGFSDIDNHGLEGVELEYDSFLKGTYGWKIAYRDAKRNLISTSGEYLPAGEGYNLVLTVDEVIQHIIETGMRDLVKKFRPANVMIIAMDPFTGEVLGMASYPNFNPNEYNKASKESFKNRCIKDTFEPGSVFKIVTASAVMEDGAVRPDDKIFCENGEYAVGKRILHDYHPYGTLTFQEVIEKSSNIGVAKAAAKVGRDRMYYHIKRFGFGSKRGIDLPAEEQGILRNKSSWTDSDMTTIPMGQGISVTALQLATAVSVVANGGSMVRPYVVKCITDKEGNALKTFRPENLGRVISDKTAGLVKGMMRGVVEKGTGTKAKLKGYTACGKTGTAQKVGEGGRYAQGKFVASFIGFAPCDDPKVAMVVCVDEPKGAHFGGTVSAPAFGSMMQNILRYLEVAEK